MIFIEQWLYRNLFAGIILAVLLTIFLLICQKRPSYFSTGQRKLVWLFLFLPCLLVWPLPSILIVSEPLYQVLQRLRLPDPLRVRLTVDEIVRSGLRMNSYFAKMAELNNIPPEAFLFYPEVFKQSELLARLPDPDWRDRLMALWNSIFPFARVLYPVGLLLTAFYLVIAHIGKNSFKQVFDFKSSRSKQSKNDRFENESSSHQVTDIEILDNPDIPNGSQESNKQNSASYLDDWYPVLSAWRDALGIYKKSRLVQVPVTGSKNKRASFHLFDSLIDRMKYRFTQQLPIPDRQPTTDDWPLAWQEKTQVSAPVAHALYHLKQPDLVLCGLYALARIVFWFLPVWYWAGRSFKDDLFNHRGRHIARCMRKRRQPKGSVSETRPSAAATAFASGRIKTCALLITGLFLTACLALQMPGQLLPAVERLNEQSIQNTGYEIASVQIAPDISRDWGYRHQITQSQTFHTKEDLHLLHLYDLNSDDHQWLLERRETDQSVVWSLDLEPFFNDLLAESFARLYPEQTLLIDPSGLFIADSRFEAEASSSQPGGDYYVLLQMTVTEPEPELELETDPETGGQTGDEAESEPGSGANQPRPERYVHYVWVHIDGSNGTLQQAFVLPDEIQQGPFAYQLLVGGDLLALFIESDIHNTSNNNDAHNTSNHNVADNTSNHLERPLVIRRYNFEGDVIWEHQGNQPGMEPYQSWRSAGAHLSMFLHYEESVNLVIADHQGGFYLVRQGYWMMLGLSPLLKPVRRSDADPDQPVIPFLRTMEQLYDPGMLYHYDADGHLLNIKKLGAEKNASVFIPRHGTVNPEGILFLAGQHIDLDIQKKLPSVSLVGQQQDLDPSYDPGELSPDAYKEGYSSGEIRAYSAEQQLVWRDRVCVEFASHMGDLRWQDDRLNAALYYLPASQAARLSPFEIIPHETILSRKQMILLGYNLSGEKIATQLLGRQQSFLHQPIVLDKNIIHLDASRVSQLEQE